MKNKETQEILMRIKQNIHTFDKEKFLEYTKWHIENLYQLIIKKEYAKIGEYVSQGVVDKLVNNQEEYRITPTMDSARVQYIELYDAMTENEIYVKVYMSIYFFDDASNNEQTGKKDIYWNDIWIATYKFHQNTNTTDLNCKNCGATMSFKERKDVMECEYCGSKSHISQSISKWILEDIERLK